MMIAAGRYEGGARPACGERKTQHPAVEIERPLQIGDFQMDMADPHPRVDGGELQGLFLEGYGLLMGKSWLSGPWLPTCKTRAW